MKKLLITLALALGLAAGHAQSQPSAKVTAKTAAITLLPKTTGTGGWVTLLSNTIKTANLKDLAIGVSCQVGLYTETVVKSKNMVSDTSFAMADVQVRVLVDQAVAEPGPVVFNRRAVTLNAVLEGQVANCLLLSTNLDGTQSIVLDPTCVTAEQIGLILDTTDASSFNYLKIDVPQGVHTISVQARIETSTTAQTGTATALALIGKSSFVCESVRLVKDPNVILDVP